MIKTGAYLLKRHSVFMRIFSAVFATVFATIFSLFFVAGCKSVEVVRPEPEMDVDSLLLLDNKSSVYLRIPANVDENLISRILQNSVQGLSPSGGAFIAEKIRIVYAGISRSRTSTSFQLVADCSIPSSLARHAFSEKNGWSEEHIALKSGENDERLYSIYTANDISLSFLGDSKVCAGRNIDKMIEKYHRLAFPFEDASSGENNTLSKGVDSLKNGAYQYLFYDKENPDGTIRFFTPRPQSFLPMLIGSTLNFNLVYVCGELFPDKKNSDQIIMQLELEFKDEKYIPFGRGVLSVSFGLSESDVYLETPTHLIVKNIKISRDQLYRIFVL